MELESVWNAGMWKERVLGWHIDATLGYLYGWHIDGTFGYLYGWLSLTILESCMSSSEWGFHVLHLKLFFLLCYLLIYWRHVCFRLFLSCRKKRAILTCEMQLLCCCPLIRLLYVGVECGDFGWKPYSNINKPSQFVLLLSLCQLDFHIRFFQTVGLIPPPPLITSFWLLLNTCEKLLCIGVLLNDTCP